jgi:RHS repeat-associated protein
MMKAAIRLLAVCIGFCLTALAVDAPASLADTSSSVGSMSLKDSPLAVEAVQPLIGGEGVIAEKKAELSTPESVAQRVSSSTAYEGLSPSEALSLANSVFPSISREPDGGLPTLPAGEAVSSFIGPNAASVSLPEGRTAVLESNGPIATQTSPGTWSGLNLGLEESNGAFVPKLSTDQPRIPKNLSEGVSLPVSKVSLTPLMASGGAVASASPGVVDGYAVFWGGLSSGSDVDMIAKPDASGGFDLETVLRSQRSPEALRFSVGLPEGAILEQPGGDTGPVLVQLAGQTIARIMPTTAVDAQGTSVSGVTMGVSGKVLTITVPHPPGQYAYPLVVDPESRDELVTGSGGHPTNWRFESNPVTGSKFTSSGWGGTEGLTMYASGSYTLGEDGMLIYPLRTGSQAKITTARFNIQSAVEGHSAEVVIDTENSKKEVEHQGFFPYNLNSGTEQESVSGKCSELSNEEECEFPGAPGNLARVALRATGTGSGATATLAKAEVVIYQEGNPGVSFNTTEPLLYFEGAPANGLYEGGGWLGPHSNNAFEFRATDEGLGIAKATVKAGSWSQEFTPYASGECEGVQCNPNFRAKISYSSAMSNGESTLEGSADDVAAGGWGGVGWATEQKLKVDAVPPHNIVLLGLGAGGQIGPGEYHLIGEATDGSGTTLSSGVKSIKLLIDGHEIGTSSAFCSPGPCTAHSGAWTIFGHSYTTGRHTVTVEATDNAGNTASETFTMIVRPATPVALGPGFLNPQSGEYSLKATDVSMGGGLTVSRSYDSEHPTAGTGGPLGTQWGVSLGGQESLAKQSSGSMVLTEASGAQTTFAPNGSGGYYSPAGDANLTLSSIPCEAGQTEFMLKNAAANTTTCFKVSSGGSGEIWSPHITQGQVATDTVTYTYETVEVPTGSGKKITRPSEALAPVPAKVSCSPELKAGCRALTFTYATKTVGEGEWGEYEGRLMKVSLVAYNPSTKTMPPVPVAQYAYDSQGRLRAEWDPGVSPALKTTYGYDSEGHVTAISPPGQQPWVLRYGTLANDKTQGRLLSITRPAASTELGSSSGSTPSGSGMSLSGTPAIGTPMALTAGTWSNKPLINTYTWEDCSTETCIPIPGADNPTYTPQPRDAGYLLMARITGTNAAGTGEQDISNATEVPLPAPKYLRKFGETGEGALKGPAADAIDGSGNIWVVDSSNSRIDEFSATGSFLKTIGWGVKTGATELQTFTSGCRAGTPGSGNGQFSKPEGIAINQSAGDMYVADKGNNRIQELSLEGVFIRKFGGYLNAPRGIGIESAGNVWVSDTGNNRVEIFTNTGVYVSSFGEAGERLGQFKGPDGITFYNGFAYIVDTGNSRVEKFNLEGRVYNEFGSKGSESTQFSSPTGIAIDPVSGDLYVDDTGNNRVQVLNQAGWFTKRFGTKGTGNGEYSSPEGIVLNPVGDIYVADTTNNRLQELEPTYSTSNPAPEPPSVGTSSVTTVEYQVPVSGTGSPYALGAKEVEAWGQSDVSTEATAIFPPSEPMGWPAKNYKNATIDYFDIKGRLVNVASPSGGIATSEYNETNDVIRTLSADNRVTALKEAKPTEAAELLSTRSKYNGETKAEQENEEKEKVNEPGTRLLETLGPQHTVKLASGSETLARSHTVYYYDEDAPSEGGPYHLVTKVTQGAQIAGKEEADIRTTTTSYSGQENLGWKLRKPTSVTAGPSGLKLTHTTIYEPATGNIVETRSPANTTGESSPPVYTSKFGTAGAEGGQLNIPVGLAVDSSNDVWVADTSNDRLEEFSPTGSFLKVIGWGVSNGKAELQTCTSSGSCRIGLEGTGNGEFAEPKGIVIDSKGNVWVADTANNRIQELSPSGTFIRAFGTEGTSNGEMKGPQGIAIDSKGNVWVAESGNNRVQELKEKGEFVAKFGSEGTGADQFKTPNDITISWGNIYIADFGNNRIDELSPTGTFIQAFGYGVADGASKPEVCTTTCQAGIAGSGNGQFSSPARIATDPNSGDLYISDHGNTRVVDIAPGGAYLGKFGASGTGEGQFTNLKGVTVNSAGDVYIADAGNSRIERWNPPAKGNTGAHNTLNVFYTATPNAIVASCGEHPEWANLPCQTQPLAQPETSGLENLPVNTISEYNTLDEPLTSIQKIGSNTRTTNITYEESGRVLSSEMKSTFGTALPKVTDKYNETTGALTEQSTSSGSLKSAFNTLGQLTSYTDASENITTYEYEKERDDLLKSVNDGKGIQAYEYNETTSTIKELKDTEGTSTLTFTANYDVEGNMISEGYPNAMIANYARNTEDEVTGVEYVKTAHCAKTCPETWYSDVVVPSIHDQWITQKSNQATQTYTYDETGRLTQAIDEVTGKGCTTRGYSYDEEGNRLHLTTRPPGTGGACTTEGGEEQTHTYDSADRMLDTGIEYDPFGNTTKLPAVDAGGTALTSTFYENNELASQTQGTQTIGDQLDPVGRTREIVSTGKTAATETQHYASSESGVPSWTGELSGNYTRYITGIGGTLVAIRHNTEKAVLQLPNLHGDIIATAHEEETSTALESTITEASEYGVPTTEGSPKYAWLGSDELRTTLSSGVIAMGARSYIPQVGRYLQTDPRLGGSVNAYAYVYDDPVNTTDLSGEWTFETPIWVQEADAGWGGREEQRQIANERAEREEAERIAAQKAAEAAYLASIAASSPTEGGPELPLGGSAGWECQDAAETGQEVPGCGGSGGGGDPVAVAAAPCAHEENAKANGCNSKGYGTFKSSCVVKFMGVVSSCNQVLANAKAEYKNDNANVIAVEKGLSEINKGVKEVEVNLRTAAGVADEIMEDVAPAA